LIRGTTRLCAVLGFPVEHSRSPQLVNAAFAAAGVDAVMVPVGVPPEGLPAAVAGLSAMRAIGASVTVPHKLAAAALCDELSPAARAIGAVNCLRFDGGRISGHNTDEGGFVDGLAAAGFDPRGRRAVLLGAGGAARAVAYGLRGAGVADEQLAVIARRPETVTPAPTSSSTAPRPASARTRRRSSTRSRSTRCAAPRGRPRWSITGGRSGWNARASEVIPPSMDGRCWCTRGRARSRSGRGGPRRSARWRARSTTRWVDRPRT
jgi:methylmalonyl-CoA mutase cobalamin-binding subunit